MSTAVLPAPVSPRDVAPSLGRLTMVELRKTVDARAGLWLQVTVAGLTVLAVGLLVAFGEEPDHVLREVLALSAGPASILLPIVGILLVASEWSQRTALITFTLVPQRWRVLAAKLLAAIVLSLAAFVVVLVVALAGTAAAGAGRDDAWDLSAALVGQHLFSLATSMMMGVAMGAALLAPAPAIVLYFALPIAWGLLGEISFLDPLADWLDTSRTFTPLTERSLSGEAWARVGTSMLLWFGVPMLIGWYRICRRELRVG